MIVISSCIKSVINLTCGLFIKHDCCYCSWEMTVERGLFFMGCTDNQFLSFLFFFQNGAEEGWAPPKKKKPSILLYHLPLPITLFLSVCRSKASKIGVPKMYIVEMTARQCGEKAWSIRHVSRQKGEGGEAEKGLGVDLIPRLEEFLKPLAVAKSVFFPFHLASVICVFSVGIFFFC